MKTRLTPADLDELIDDVRYIQEEGTTLTVCVLTLLNGCEVVGTSNVILAENYDAQLGRDAAFNNTKSKIWELEGYALKRAQFDLVLRAARTAHEVNRIYCRSIGDTSQLPWHDSPSWQVNSAIAGVEAIVANPNQTPEQSHESWLAHKIADGWVYGPVKDTDKKEHPCMVPYADLPDEQRIKDALFTTTVKAILG